MDAQAKKNMPKFKVGDEVIYIDTPDNPYKKGPFKSCQVKVEEIIEYKAGYFYNLSDGIFHARPCHIYTKEQAQQKFNEWLNNKD